MAGFLLFAGISLLAYVVKAATGFGPAIIIVALGSLVVGPLNAVVLAAFLDVVGGLAVMWGNRRHGAPDRWAGLAVTMAAGAVAGGLLLPHIPTATLSRVVGLGVLAAGLSMLVAAHCRQQPDRPTRRSDRPVVDYLVVTVSGIAGGLIGVGGPPLVLYFGSRLRKADFRAMIVPMLLAAAVARVLTYATTGQVDREVLFLLGVSLPALPVGMILGNRFFHGWSEKAFQLAVASLLVVAGLRLVT